MTMIVGYAPDERGRAALHLGALLARSAGDRLVVCSVVPSPWVPGMARVDAEYRSYLDATADEALERARANLPGGVEATFVRHSARSAAVGLLELAAEHEAVLVVLGSSSAGAFGHIVLGSVTDRLLHSSPVSLALAPRGFRSRDDAMVSRVTTAYGGTSAESLVVAAASVAERVGARLRIASFAVWTKPPYTMTLGTDSEDLVLREWTAALEKTAQLTLTRVEGLPATLAKVETVIGRGATWQEALDDVGWTEGDVMVVGSSELGPVAQVFLGSRATKILRHSPVPVVVVPRERADVLAERAAGASGEER
jgi:nucleotide-binding universal stress UspA family protein